ncbi:ArpU family phage packaging/lysis transcriptional regulator [Aneurinibacillus thermoaerophilus]|uniref:Phage transcriptional regulator, ArpU family n=1 Tax=Aneurinibacillus thermoaerophilus TaxID=143495 RepID=A0A1G8BGG4_ANETH|nr:MULTISPECIES: ArpU family phage packaging/lysis transcriptional regulator [Aneurinibacillus]MED0674259.1 ArpU family phage packaging/lysis transcriptional regulator [Aneurinibacillus thermoaerophilus]MED0678645.1 ArpU family phage packaging/lysis transcriptional regulator [Aneurinibacillus thermoaerophilus]MED0737809.1 ArpU family phage packaging/lysis transcriptional regulator [Aneurinibacillus thermoaerophilus]MED0755841.1 ArpU family phage packaging/lysis transcriptional regulator [Aneuri
MLSNYPLYQQLIEKEVRKVVVKELKKYKALRVAVQNRKEQEEQGVRGLFPALYESDKQKEMKVRQIERALQYTLDEIERRIIEEKYLGTTRVKDITLYLDMGLTKEQYYMKKKEAIFQIATALGII